MLFKDRNIQKIVTYNLLFVIQKIQIWLPWLRNFPKVYHFGDLSIVINPNDSKHKHQLLTRFRSPISKERQQRMPHYQWLSRRQSM